MKRALAVAAAAAAVFCGTAVAETVPQLQTATLKTFNQRLTFTGSPYRLKTVRCQKETAAAFFCIGTLQAAGLPTEKAYWNATISNGVIHWTIQR